MHFTSEQFKFTHQTNTYKGNIRICIWEAQEGVDATETVEFKVSNERYKGEDLNSKLGDSIEVVYLPKNPKINRKAKAIDQDWCVWVYRKITE